MARILLFTDGSVHVQSGIGYGAFLFVSEIEESVEKLKKDVQTKRFDLTSSTKLELQTLLWALSGLQETTNEIIVFSDSQNISGLLARRERLERNNFKSKTNKRLTNADLYMQFFSIINLLDVQFVKVKGHKSSREKNKIDQIFTLVDRASRQALRNEVKE